MLPDHPLKRFKLFRSKDLVESKPSKGPEKLTEKEWINKLKDSKNTKDWIAPCLSSDLELVAKVRVLDVVPSSFYKDSHGMRQLMTELDRSGLSQLYQFIRLKWFLKNIKDSRTDSELRWCQEAVKADILGRQIVQREIYIKEQMHALQKSLDLSSLSDTDTSSIPRRCEEQYKSLGIYEEKLENINREYLIHYRNHWKIQVEAPRGPLRCAFEFTRRHSMWASLPWLKEDCAGRGGCCARSCGCCAKPRDTNRHLYNQGHCTTACACCIHAHAIDDQNVLDDIKDFPFDATSLPWSGYTRRVIQAYIFGLDSISLNLV